jgi:hypothetical protein
MLPGHSTRLPMLPIDLFRAHQSIAPPTDAPTEDHDK